MSDKCGRLESQASIAFGALVTLLLNSFLSFSSGGHDCVCHDVDVPTVVSIVTELLLPEFLADSFAIADN